MANYTDNGRSFINGLSDYWLLYFKEVNQLEALYKGVEVQVGQSYLDLLGLLLNNSLQDTPVFNKEYWKLFQVRESDIRYRAGSTATTGRYLYELPDNAVFARHLNNKILNSTANLDKDVEFFVNDAERRLEFIADPLNAYGETTIGSGNSAIRIRSRLLLTTPVQVFFDDTGGPLTITRDGYDIIVEFDGPTNTSTTLARDIVQLLNTQVDTAGLVFAELTGLGTGTASPPGPGVFETLSRVAVNPLDNFATRIVDQAFGAKFTCGTVHDWIDADIEKGDTLRLISGPNVGTPVELEINTVRSTALFLEAGNTVSVGTGDRVDFVVLRSADGHTSYNEPMAQAGQNIQSGIDGTVIGATRRFSSPTAVFNAVHEGDLIEILGTANAGYGKILEVIDPFTVTLGLTTLVDETPVVWNLVSVIDPTNTGTNGVLTNLGTGSATFTSATGVFTAAAVGTVLKLSRAGIIETYAITGYTSATTITIAAAATVVDGAGISWGWGRFVAASTTVIFSPPTAWPTGGTIAVAARRLLDSAAVQEGIDYEVSVDLGRIKPITIWETSVTNTVSYDYRIAIVENITDLQDGITGTITPGTTNIFSAPTAVFTAADIGNVISVSNSGLILNTNNGVHTIAAVLSATSVALTTDKVVSSVVDPNNGSLAWELLRRGTLTASTDAAPITELISEIAFWAPDVLVDRFHLYNTYGYLLSRYERSSEEYRALIRGIFQLFMLGPTLERLESAINTVAGISVIRDDGEILIGYEDGALDTGTDGVFDATTLTFTSASAAFTAEHLSYYIYATTGTNANKLFKIQTVVNATSVTLSETPVSDSAVTWELTSSAEHTVITSRTAYTFRRDIPLRDNVTDSANIGVYLFRAFEVLTDVFTVTDYIEDPTWWEFVQIPLELIPNQSAERRQSSPVLFENVVSPADDGRIGDPGFYIGADSEGYVSASSVLRSGAAGILIGDPFYPISNNVYFEAATAAFTATDIGNFVTIGTSQYRITLVVSATRVEIEAFVDVADQTGLAWQITSGPVPKRYKAAFIILDKVLKHHLFSVRFDIALMNQLSLTLLEDLQELVFVAKPAYTYIVLSPSALFDEVIRITEDLEMDIGLIMGGDEGEIIAANAAPLLVIGASWRIGNWFRYISTTSTFATPVVQLPVPMGLPAGGYANKVNKFYVTPTSFTSGAAPIQQSDVIITSTGVVSTGVLTVAGGNTLLTFPAAHVAGTDLLQYVTIAGSGLGNNGRYRIGAVLSSTQVRLSPQASASEAALTTTLFTGGSTIGQVTISSEGQVTFTDLAGRARFAVGHEGTYIRRPFVSDLRNQLFEIYAINSFTEVQIASEHRVHPVSDDPDVVVSLSTTTLKATFGEYIFSLDMAYEDRRIANPSTALQKQYFVECTSGVNTGLRYRIEKYISPNQVRLSGGLTDPAVDTRIVVVEAPACIAEITEWEHVKDQISISASHRMIDFDTPTQDINPAVPYTAYGVREPVNPSTAAFFASSGDTRYSVGMSDPRQARGRSRTGRDTDLREEPVQITRI